MNRRRFLKDATQGGVGMGIGGSLLASQAHSGKKGETTDAPSGTSKLGGAARFEKNLVVGTPVVSLDGEWLLVTDPQNIGRSEGWFDRPESGGKPARVPGVIQEAFPAYHGVVWYQRDFVAP